MIRRFLSYSNQDEDLRKEAQKHLAALRRDGVIDIWQDRRIGPGDEFDREISKQPEPEYSTRKTQRYPHRQTLVIKSLVMH
jgi:hypothetical protein